MDSEREGLLAAGVAAGKKINRDGGIRCYKGRGEMDAKELWETTMNPAARVLRQVTMNDASAAEAMFSLLMGEDVEARRQFITATHSTSGSSTSDRSNAGGRGTGHR